MYGATGHPEATGDPRDPASKGKSHDTPEPKECGSEPGSS